MLRAASGHLVHGRHLVGAVPVGDTHGGSVGATLLWAGHGRCPYGLAVGKHRPLQAGRRQGQPLWPGRGQASPLVG
ncbi:hypothetical protein BHM03_00051678 [Ensete ventricosum]|nr:hypothetical protein BHM03_00051678 [Ensete ventricosum]